VTKLPNEMEEIVRIRTREIQGCKLSILFASADQMDQGVHVG